VGRSLNTRVAFIRLAPMRRASLVLLALSLVFGATALAAPAQRGNGPPSNFVRHAGAHWTWYGPQGWIDSQGANDLYVGSPTGTLFLHYGASAAPCSYPGAYTTIGQFFAYVRKGYLAGVHQNYDFYSFGLSGAKFTSKPAPRRIGSNYYRQVLKFRGRRPNGKQIKGEMVIDFFYAGSGACGERQQVRSAPARGNRGSIRLLRQVQKYIFGPH
jgi:hypothetical protein